MNFSRATIQKFRNFGERQCLISANKIITYEDILRDMSDFDIVGHSLIVCIIDNDINGIKGYISLLLSSAVIIILNFKSPIDYIQAIREKYRPSWMWIEASRVNEIECSHLIFTLGDYALVRLKEEKREDLHPSLKLLLQTSGSTGNPKLVRISEENLISNAKSIIQYLKIYKQDIPITTLPPYYTYGLSIIHSHLFAGSPIALTKRTFFDNEFWEFFRAVNATSFGGVPFHYEILKRIKFLDLNLPSLRKMTQAGGHMDPDLTLEFARYADEHKVEFFKMYGQTEATSRIAFLSPDLLFKKPSSIGKAIPGGRLWLEDSSGSKIEEINVEGELVYEGPNVSLGYAEKYEDLSKGDERLGVLRTGDLATRDNDGDYFIVGRIKRMIKLFGHRVNLIDIENFLSKNSISAACTGIDDSLEVFAVNLDATQALNIKRLISKHLNISNRAIGIYTVESLPRNFGKIEYAKLRSIRANKVA